MKTRVSANTEEIMVMLGRLIPNVKKLSPLKKGTGRKNKLGEALASN